MEEPLAKGSLWMSGREFLAFAMVMLLCSLNVSRWCIVIHSSLITLEVDVLLLPIWILLSGI